MSVLTRLAAAVAHQGDRSIDYAWWRPDLGSLRHFGYVGIERYISFDASKDISAAELQAALAAGLTVVFVWEATGDEAKGGYSVGADRAQRMNARLAALGIPTNVGVGAYFATDFDATPDQVRAYYQGIRDHCAYRPGSYGGIRVVDAMLSERIVQLGWQTCAWSGGLVSKLAHLYQRLSTTTGLVGSYDENVALQADYGQWPRPGVTPTPPPEEDDEVPYTQAQTDALYGQQVAEFVQEQYRTVLATPVPDVGGFNYWCNEIISGRHNFVSAASQFIATANLPKTQASQLKNAVLAERRQAAKQA